MFIKSITIRGFRCFGKNANPISFEEKNGLIPFVGVNGSGKTAVLEAIHLLFGSDRRNRIEITEKDFHFESRDTNDCINITAKTEPFFFSVEGLKTETSKGEDKGRKNIIVACDQVSLTIRRRKRASNGSVLDNPYIFDKKCIPIEGKIDEKIIIEMKKVKERLDNIVCKITEKENINANENIVDIIRYAKTLAGCKEQIEEGFIQEMIEEIEENSEKKKIYSLKLESSPSVNNFHEDNLRFREEDIYGISRTYYLSKNRTNETKEKFSLLAD
ncbi:MAG: DUF2813 domain-containing protein, partial [Candidatus Moranbacteria bacterium]|nr:DUF2813 domain-containing protein [Candidatus Moranbacteria bacterium]